jgi:hypothetical protein
MEKQSNTEIVIAERIHCQPWVVVRNCDARYLGGRNKRITSSRPTWDISWDPVSKTKYTHTHNTNQRAGGVAQVADNLPSYVQRPWVQSSASQKRNKTKENKASPMQCNIQANVISLLVE